MVFMRFDPLRGPDALANQAIGSTRAARSLPIQMLRRGDRLMVAIEVPGVDPRDVEVIVERNVVEIVGRRRSVQREGDEVIVDERAHGEFRRQLFLGVDLDPRDMTAACERGVLTLTVSWSQVSKPRKVEIDSADEGRQALRSGPKQPRILNV
jgi:HSP20 family protein